MTNWSRVGFVALTAVMLAGCSSTRSTTVQGTSGSPATPTSTAVERASAHAAEAPIGEVPWSQVGAGWMLAMWSPVPAMGAGAEPGPAEPTPQTSATTLYLVSPEGD
jgi:TolB protein